MNKETKFAQPPYSNDIDEIAIGEPITIFVGEGSAPIATVNNYDDFPCADEDQMEEIDAQAQATARLFCASPDLLEACLSAVTDEKDDPCQYDHKGLCQAHGLQPKGQCYQELLRAAINKASGNANQEVSE